MFILAMSFCFVGCKCDSPRAQDLSNSTPKPNKPTTTTKPPVLNNPEPPKPTKPITNPTTDQGNIAYQKANANNANPAPQPNQSTTNTKLPTLNNPEPGKPKTPVTKLIIAKVNSAYHASHGNKWVFLLETLHALQKDDPIAIQNINQLNPSNPKHPFTVLHEAADLGDVDVVQALLDRGAKANIQDPNKELPLHKALSKGHFEVAKLLLKQENSTQALKLASTDTGWKPLAIAIYTGKLKLVKLLLEHSEDSIDAEVDIYEKMTALHIAAMAVRSNLAIVRYLVEEQHAQLNPRDCYQKTPLDWAMESEDQEIADYLRAKGATSGQK
jgi:hypothetical protein